MKTWVRGFALFWLHGKEPRLHFCIKSETRRCNSLRVRFDSEVESHSFGINGMSSIAFCFLVTCFSFPIKETPQSRAEAAQSTAEVVRPTKKAARGWDRSMFMQTQLPKAYRAVKVFASLLAANSPQTLQGSSFFFFWRASWSNTSQSKWDILIKSNTYSAEVTYPCRIQNIEEARALSCPLEVVPLSSGFPHLLTTGLGINCWVESIIEELYSSP
jgi:hypothetical protein